MRVDITSTAGLTVHEPGGRANRAVPPPAPERGRAASNRACQPDENGRALMWASERYSPEREVPVCPLLRRFRWSGPHADVAESTQL